MEMGDSDPEPCPDSRATTVDTRWAHSALRAGSAAAVDGDAEKILSHTAPLVCISSLLFLTDCLKGHVCENFTPV